MVADTAAGSGAPRVHLIRATCGLGVTQLIGWGTVFFALPVVAAPVGQAFGIRPETVFLGITIMLLINAFAGPWLGDLVDRYGGRVPMAAGTVMTSLGLAILALAADRLAFWAAWIVLGVSAPLILSNGCYPALSQLAGTRSRQAVSSLTLFSGSAITVFYPTTYLLDEAFGWRVTFLLYAALHLAVSLPILLAVLPKRAGSRHRRDAAVEPALQGRRQRVVALCLSAVFALHVFIANGLALNFIVLYESLGIERSAAVTIMALAGIVQMLTRLVEVLLSGRYPATVTLLISCALQVPGLLVVLVAQGPVGAAMFAIVCAVSNGLMAIARASVPLALFGSQIYGAGHGWLTLPFSIMSAAAPFAFAQMMAVSGPIASLQVAVGLSTVSFALCLTALHTWRRQPR